MTMSRIQFDGDRLAEDLALRGWTARRLAAQCDPPVAVSTVTRFLNGQSQTAQMAKRFADALGYSVRRYLISRRKAA